MRYYIHGSGLSRFHVILFFPYWFGFVATTQRFQCTSEIACSFRQINHILLLICMCSALVSCDVLLFQLCIWSCAVNWRTQSSKCAIFLERNPAKPHSVVNLAYIYLRVKTARLTVYTWSSYTAKANSSPRNTFPPSSSSTKYLQPHLFNRASLKMSRPVCTLHTAKPFFNDCKNLVCTVAVY